MPDRFGRQATKEAERVRQRERTGARGILRVARDESGQTLVEYALILALVSLVLAGALGALSDSVAAFFSDVVSKLDDL